MNINVNINFVTGEKFTGKNGTTLSIFLKKLPVMITQQEQLNFLSDFQEMLAIGHIGKIISYDFHTNQKRTKSYAFMDLQLYNTTRALIFKKAVSSTPYKISMNGIEIANYISKEERQKKDSTKRAIKNAKKEEIAKQEETKTYTFGYIDKWVVIEGQDDTEIRVLTCNGIEENDWTDEMKTAFEETQYKDYVEEDDNKEWDKHNDETFGNYGCDRDYDYEDEEADLKMIANLCSFLSMYP
jgi:hypothetical protein